MPPERMGPPPEVISFEAGVERIKGALRPKREKETEDAQIAKAFESIGKAAEVQDALDALTRLADDHESLQAWVQKKLKTFRDLRTTYLYSAVGHSHSEWVEDRIKNMIHEVTTIEKAIGTNLNHLNDGIQNGDKTIEMLDSKRWSTVFSSGVADFIKDQEALLARSADNNDNNYQKLLMVLQGGPEVIKNLEENSAEEYL